MIKKKDEFEIYTQAMMLVNSVESLKHATPFTLEETVEALKQTNFDSQRALAILEQKRRGDGQFRDEAMNEEEDLYQ